mgnify:CR=1 FL=1
MMNWLMRRFVALTIIAASAWTMWVGNTIAKLQWTHTREQIASDLFMEEKQYLESLDYCTDVWYVDMYENDRGYKVNLVMEDGNHFETFITSNCSDIYMQGYYDTIQPYWES